MDRYLALAALRGSKPIAGRHSTMCGDLFTQYHSRLSNRAGARSANGRPPPASRPVGSPAGGRQCAKTCRQRVPDVRAEISQATAFAAVHFATARRRSEAWPRAALGPGCVKTITLKKCTKCNSSKRSRPPPCQHHQSPRRSNRIKILLVSRKASEFSHGLGHLQPSPGRASSRLATGILRKRTQIGPAGRRGLCATT
jgi:hypothetical protein